MEYLKKKITVSYGGEVKYSYFFAIKCMQDLKQQNELMAETKLLLEEKVQSVEKKLMDYGEVLINIIVIYVYPI